MLHKVIRTSILTNNSGNIHAVLRSAWPQILLEDPLCVGFDMQSFENTFLKARYLIYMLFREILFYSVHFILPFQGAQSSVYCGSFRVTCNINKVQDLGLAQEFIGLMYV